MSLAEPFCPDQAGRRRPSTRPEHEAFRDTVRRFVDREIMPFVDEWDEAAASRASCTRRHRPRASCSSAFPEAYGGVPTDPFFGIIKSEEMARHGSGGVNASLNSHTIGCAADRARWARNG